MESRLGWDHKELGELSREFVARSAPAAALHTASDIHEAEGGETSEQLGSARRDDERSGRPHVIGWFAEASDQEIVCALQNRIEEALAELFRRHGAMVLGIAKRIVGDLALAEDVTQEVFLSFWQNPGTFDSRRGPIRGLLAVRSHGKSVDVVRSRSARAAREAKRSESTSADAAEVDSDLMADLTNRELHKAMQKLSATERSAISLAFFGSQTYKQVAVTLGIPEGTAKTRIRSGLARLHSLLLAADELP